MKAMARIDRTLARVGWSIIAHMILNSAGLILLLIIGRGYWPG